MAKTWAGLGNWACTKMASYGTPFDWCKMRRVCQAWLGEMDLIYLATPVLGDPTPSFPVLETLLLHLFAGVDLPPAQVHRLNELEESPLVAGGVVGLPAISVCRSLSMLDRVVDRAKHEFWEQGLPAGGKKGDGPGRLLLVLTRDVALAGGSLSFYAGNRGVSRDLLALCALNEHRESVQEWVELLVGAGAEVDASGAAAPDGPPDSCTALMQLCDRPTRKGRRETRLPGVRALVEAGADVRRRTRAGRPPCSSCARTRRDTPSRTSRPWRGTSKPGGAPGATAAE